MSTYNLVLSVFLVVSCYIAYGENKLIRGKPVRAGEFQEVVDIRSCDQDEGFCSGCTATVIGPRVLLTAAHCTDNNASIEFKYKKEKFAGTCTHHPLYKKEQFDMALCEIEKEINVKYAYVSTVGPKVKEYVTLAGYGCTQPRDRNGNGGGTGGNDGILRVGESKVWLLPKNVSGSYWFWTRSNSALCYGDSGGPTFKQIINPETETHIVYGINSRGNIRDVSFLTAVYLDKSIKFLKKFSDERSLKVCGVTSSCLTDY